MTPPPASPASPRLPPVYPPSRPRLPPPLPNACACRLLGAPAINPHPRTLSTITITSPSPSPCRSHPVALTLSLSPLSLTPLSHLLHPHLLHPHPPPSPSTLTSFTLTLHPHPSPSPALDPRREQRWRLPRVHSSRRLPQRPAAHPQRQLTPCRSRQRRSPSPLTSTII